MLQASRWRGSLCQAALWLALAALGGCGSAPPRASGGPSGPAVTPRAGPAPSSERDGPDAQPPADLANVPDAQPRLENIRAGGPNKPYQVLGRHYTPISDDRPFSERGLASWYGRKFHGRRTASGEVYNMYAMTAAHPTLPIPSYVRVRNPANQREVIVRVNDRGPFHPGRVIDLSYTAAYKLGLLRGVAPVELARITFDEIRAGSWRTDSPGDAAPAERPATQLAQASETPAVVVAPAPPAEGPVDAPMPTAAPRGAAGFWVQLGAFRQREGADGFQRRVLAEIDWLAPLLAVFSEPNSHRLQAGPYASRGEAQDAAQRIRDALSLVPLIVERR